MVVIMIGGCSSQAIRSGVDNSDTGGDVVAEADYVADNADMWMLLMRIGVVDADTVR